MKYSNILENSVKRVLLGLLLLFAGVGLGWLSENSRAIVAHVCPSEPSFWCFPVKLALLEVGLKSISYTFIVLGCVLVVLYNFVAELLGAILSFALNHVANSSRVVIDAMERNRITREESANIIIQTISRYMGYYDKNSQSFAEFMQKRIVDQVYKDGGFWRKDYSAVVNVEKVTSADPVGDASYLKWFEMSRFTVENSEKGKTYRYSSGSSVELKSIGDALVILKAIKYDIRAGGRTVFSFSEYKDDFDIDSLTGADGYKRDGLRVKIDGMDLDIKVELPLFVSERELDIVVDEESFISVGDTTYELSFFEPTKGLTFRFNLPEGFTVFHRGVSGRRFGTSRTDTVTMSHDSDNRVRIDAVEWCLPGIVTMFAWTT